MIKEIIKLEGIVLDSQLTQKGDILEVLADLAVTTGAGANRVGVLTGLLDRESMVPTNVGYGVAIPHCRCGAISNTQILFMKLNENVLWDDTGEELVNLVFAILTPADGGNEHLMLISKLARNLLKESFLESLHQASKASEILVSIQNVLGGEE